MVKNVVVSANAGDTGDLGWILGGENPLEGEMAALEKEMVFLLGNPMDRGAWQATVHRVTNSWTGLKQLSTQATPFRWSTAILIKRKTFTPSPEWQGPAGTSELGKRALEKDVSI